MGEFYLGLFTGVVILVVAVPLIQWLSEPAPRQDDPEMKRLDLYA